MKEDKVQRQKLEKIPDDFASFYGQTYIGFLDDLLKLNISDKQREGLEKIREDYVKSL